MATRRAKVKAYVKRNKVVTATGVAALPLVTFIVHELSKRGIELDPTEVAFVATVVGWGAMVVRGILDHFDPDIDTSGEDA